MKGDEEMGNLKQNFSSSWRKNETIEFNDVIQLTVINLVYTKRCFEGYNKIFTMYFTISSLWFNLKIKIKQ